MFFKRKKKLNKAEKNKKPSIFIKFYKKYTKKHWRIIIFAFFLNWLVAGSTAGVAYLIGPAVGDVFQDKNISLLTKMAIAIVGCFILKAVAVYFYKLCMEILSLKIINAIRFDIFKKLVSMRMKDINNLEKGHFMTLIQNDLVNIQVCLANVVVDIIKDIIQIFCLTIVVFKSNWKMAIFICLLYPLLFLPFKKLSRKIKKKTFLQQNSLQLLTSKIIDVQNGIKTIKVYNSSKNENVYFLNLMKDFIQKALSSIRISALYSPINEVFGGLIIGVLLIAGGYQVIYQSMSLSNFTSFLAALMMMIRPIKTLIDMIARLPNSIVSMERVDKFFTDTPKEDLFIGLKPDLTNPLIEFKNVNFNYISNQKGLLLDEGETNKVVLNDINIKIQPKSKIAFVGTSGSGKSTIMNLLMRLYEQDDGEILINNEDIKNISISHLRKNIAYVCQDNFLFDSTIRDNIIYNTPKNSFDDNDLANVISMAKADFIYNLPDKLETEVGLEGSKLSMGQKQRIAIARALLRKTPIMIFDEVTSALDANTEADIRDMIFKQLKDKTIFLIAHRLTTITECDCIYVMSNGQIVESGSHSELLDKKGVYSDMWKNFQNNQ